jgi:hypothetical protein
VSRCTSVANLSQHPKQRHVRGALVKSSSRGTQVTALLLPAHHSCARTTPSIYLQVAEARAAEAAARGKLAAAQSAYEDARDANLALQARLRAAQVRPLIGAVFVPSALAFRWHAWRLVLCQIGECAYGLFRCQCADPSAAASNVVVKRCRPIVRDASPSVDCERQQSKLGALQAESQAQAAEISKLTAHADVSHAAAERSAQEAARLQTQVESLNMALADAKDKVLALQTSADSVYDRSELEKADFEGRIASLQAEVNAESAKAAAAKASLEQVHARRNVTHTGCCLLACLLSPVKGV